MISVVWNSSSVYFFWCFGTRRFTPNKPRRHQNERVIEATNGLRKEAKEHNTSTAQPWHEASDDFMHRTTRGQWYYRAQIYVRAENRHQMEDGNIQHVPQFIPVLVWEKIKRSPVLKISRLAACLLSDPFEFGETSRILSPLLQFCIANGFTRGLFARPLGLRSCQLRWSPVPGSGDLFEKRFCVFFPNMAASCGRPAYKPWASVEKGQLPHFEEMGKKDLQASTRLFVTVGSCSLADGGFGRTVQYQSVGYKPESV